VKNKRLFGIVNTLNIVLWIAFIINRLWDYYSTNYINHESDGALFLILGILSIIVFLFSFFCYKLTKTFRAALPLSDSSRLIAPIIVILYTILTMILAWISISNFKNYFAYRFSGYESWILISLVLDTLSITSIYLCIAYWIIRKEIKTQLTGIITDLGKETNS